MKNIFSVATVVAFCLLFSASVSAAVPPGNQVKIGNISALLPAEKMRRYYAKMEPLMLKYFGPPFSDFTMNIVASPEKDGLVDVDAQDKTLYLYSLARDYLRL